MSFLSNLAPVIGGVGGFLAGGPAGAAIGAGIGSAYSNAASASEAISAQKEMNADNIAMQRETNDIQIELANTAHQREVSDLRAAGLNPILSAKYGGSATPGLTSPSMTSIAPIIQNSAQQSAVAALNFQNMAADLAVKKATVLATSAQAVSAGEDARRKAMENDVMEMEQPGKKYIASQESKSAPWSLFLRDLGRGIDVINPFKGAFSGR